VDINSSLPPSPQKKKQTIATDKLVTAKKHNFSQTGPML